MFELKKKKDEIIVCSNCVMDSTDTAISFDADGQCDHCRTFRSAVLPNWDTGEKGREELAQLAEKIKKHGRGKDFDCIIGMSGGIDSSYLVYIAKEILGLRPLVFHVDAGWNSQIAITNIERIVDGLGLDLFTEVIDWEEMKDLQRAFFKSGVPHIDSPQDHAFFAAMYRFASQHKVKFILTGANYATEGIRNPVEWVYYADYRQICDIHRRFGERPLRTYPTTNILWHKLWLPFIEGVKVYRPLNFLPYVKEEAKQILIDRFEWQPYPQKHFESRFTRFYESFWLPVRFGFDVRKVQLSSLILSGQKTRDEAIAELQSPPFDPEYVEKEMEFIANKLDFELDELKSYLNLPLKSFRDYRNQYPIYSFGAWASKKLKLELGGKR